jgi:solute carrier family 25 carnitine/acylcarnitine transporter 20/29
VDVLRNLVFRHGLRRGLFLGLGATLLRDIPSFGFYFGFYEMLRRVFAGSDRSVSELSGLETMVAGAAGGMASWVVIYPLDVVKSRLQAQDLDHRVFRGMWDCMTQTYRSGGTRALFSGLGITVVRSIPVNMAVFYTYELLNRYFD